MIRNSKSHHSSQKPKSKERNAHQHHYQQYQRSGRVLASPVEWFLLQRTGTIAFRLNPNSVILIGSEQCDINIQSPSVEKRHAVLCFDPNSECFSVKDLNTTNGTFLNNRRISSDRPEKLSNMDLLRFGYDSNLYEIRLGSAAGPAGIEVQQNEQRNVNKSPTTSDIAFGGSSSNSVIPERFSHVMQQSSRGNSLYGSRVSSPSLTLDSGRGSSSAPSSPAKEMSPVPVSNATSSNIQLSPSFPRKMTKQDVENNPQNISSQKKGHVGPSGDLRLKFTSNSQEQLRKDSLEDKIDHVIDNIVFPKTTAPRQGSSVLSMRDLEHDLNVPNEIFSEQHEPKQELIFQDPTNSCSKRDGMSRPRSFSGGSLNGHAPRNAPSPLYGTPHWWPQEEHSFSPNDCGDEHVDEVDDDEPPSCTCSQIIRDDRSLSGRDTMEPISLSESNNSFESESQSESVSSDKKKVSPMAFTVDFDDGPKKFGISDSISKFAPKHRRNTSLTKVEDIGTKMEKDDSSISKETISLPTRLANRLSSVRDKSSELKMGTSASVSKSSRIAKLTIDNKSTDSPGESESNALLKKSRNSNDFASKLCKPKPTLSSSLLSSRVQPSKETNKIDACSNDLLSKTIPNTNTISQVPKSNVANVLMEKSTVTNNKPVIETEDASSETGTYTIEKDSPDVNKARKDIENVFGLDAKLSDSEVNNVNGVEDPEQEVGSGAPEWVREWAEQAAIQHKKIKERNPLPDTQLFLQETENLVSAMQERVTRNLSNNNSSHNSDSDDEATLSHSPPKSMSKTKRPISTRTSPLPREASVLSDSGYQIGYQSDSSNEGLREYKNIGAVKMNKAFNIRRGRVIGYESDTATALNRHSLTLPVRGISPRPPVGSNISTSTNASFARNDGGRFSLRMPKSRTPPNQMLPPMMQPRSSPAPSPSPAPKVTNKQQMDYNHNASRKSTPQAKNVNANARKPPAGSRSNSTLTAKEVELANWKRRKSYDPMRAAAEGRKKRESSSAIETTIDDVTPTSLSKHSAAMMSKSMSFHMESNFSPKCHSEEEDMIYVVDEVDSSHSNSPIHIPMNRSSHEDSRYHGLSHSPLRPKNKLEALDNLVIATIHSLSNKVRTSSRHLLEKLQIQHADNENGALLEEMVSQLKELEMSSTNSSPNKSPSRELSGTLKNLKKLEQVVLVLDRVLCDDSGSDINT